MEYSPASQNCRHLHLANIGSAGFMYSQHMRIWGRKNSSKIQYTVYTVHAYSTVYCIYTKDAIAKSIHSDCDWQLAFRPCFLIFNFWYFTFSIWHWTRLTGNWFYGIYKPIKVVSRVHDNRIFVLYTKILQARWALLLGAGWLFALRASVI